MKTIEEINKTGDPSFVIDKKLEQLRGKTLFPEKLAQANEILSKSKLPELKKDGK